MLTENIIRLSSLESDITTYAILAVFAIMLIIVKTIKDGKGNGSDSSGSSRENNRTGIPGMFSPKPEANTKMSNGLPSFIENYQVNRPIAEDATMYPHGIKPKTISVRNFVIDKIPDFDEDAEKEKIGQAVCEYILATSKGNKRFERLRKCCSKPVVTAAQFEVNTSRLEYSAPMVDKVEFTRCETHALEISLFGLAHAEFMCKSETTNLPFEATYEFRYSYDYRENTDRTSLKCPKCGAPISDYNMERCPFCDVKLGSMLMERSWTLTEINRTNFRKKYIEKKV